MDGLNPVLFLGDSATGVGDLDDVEGLLAGVSGDQNSCLSSLSLLSSEYRVGTILGGGRSSEVRIVVLLRDVYGELQQIPVQGILYYPISVFFLPDGSGPAGGCGFGVPSTQDLVVGSVGIAARLAGQWVLGEGFLATEYELVGDEG